MATLSRRKNSSKETSEVSTSDIENGRTTLYDNAKSGGESPWAVVNTILFFIAISLTLSILSKEEILTPKMIVTNPIFHKYVKTFYGEDKYIRFLDQITLADGAKDTITEVKAETSVSSVSDTTPKMEPKVEPKPSPTKIDTDIVKATINTSPFCPDCVYDATTMGDISCLARSQYFMQKYGLTEEKSKTAVMKDQPTNCKKAPSFCAGCLFNVNTMGDISCLGRSQYFMQKYGLAEEKAKTAVMEAEPSNCVLQT